MDNLKKGLALYCIMRAILYPMSKIITISKNSEESVNNIKEIKSFIDKYEAIANDISPKAVRVGLKEGEANFKNGSKINTISLSFGIRGYRADTILLDESVSLSDFGEFSWAIRHINTYARDKESVSMNRDNHFNKSHCIIPLDKAIFSNRRLDPEPCEAHFKWAKEKFDELLSVQATT